MDKESNKLYRKGPILIIDSREKIPWSFEGDDAFEDIIHEKLDQGDYSLAGLEHVVSIERKANGDELYINLYSPEGKERIYAEMCRLAGQVKYRFIIIEQDLQDIMSPNAYRVNTLGKNKRSPYMPPAVVMEHLIKFMIDYGVYVIFAGQKGKSIAKKILLTIYDQYKKGRLPC